jgi:NhaP-type Na+/H+ or K+/H+ antiporter
MLAVLSFLAVIAVSLIIVRVASIALTYTGLSSPLARFQARSAFTGAGFTTNESEKVVQHPVRRRIIMILMLLGNAGVVTAVSSLLLSFLGEEQTWGPYTRSALLLLGLLCLWWLATSRWVDRQVSRIIRWALKRFTTVDVRDYAGLLHLTGDYVDAQ